MIPTLRGYQVQAGSQVVEECKKGRRVVILQCATGGGKTNIACDLVGKSAAKGCHVLVLAHLRKLVEQFSERLFDFQIDHGVFMRGHRLEKEARVQVASRDTILARCVNNEYLGLPRANLVILDEARHGAIPGRAYRKLLDHYQKQGAFIVGLDATPVLADGSGLAPWAKSLVVAAPTTQLIRDSYLVPFRCYAPDRKRMHGKRIKRGIAGSLVESWKMYGENQPTVLFTSRVKHSQAAVQEFNDNGIAAVHVDADTPDYVRDQAIADLETGKVKILANVGIVGEGVDIPCLGCVQFFMDPQSRTRFLQGAGRVMRPYDGKNYAILIDHAAAVFRHGFPDEDTEWTLEGNVDARFRQAHKQGKTKKALYCADCERLYTDQVACPQCGKMPVQPPRSIFAPVAQDHSDELLTEADRSKSTRDWYSKDEKIRHWLRCLGMNFHQDGTFSRAVAVWKKKYPNEWPGDDFPCLPDRGQWKNRIREVFPDFGKKKQLFSQADPVDE